MSVYVDPLFRWPNAPKIRGRNVEWCHLTADTPDELHAFAAQLGLKRAWAQRDTYAGHYDLTAGMRARAVRLGAAELTRDEAGARLRAIREARQRASVLVDGDYDADDGSDIDEF